MMYLCSRLRLCVGWLTSLLAVSLGFAQDSTRVTVIRLDQVVRTSPLVVSVMDEESFPDYLRQNPALRQQVYTQLQPLLSDAFPGKIVAFSSADSPLRYQNATPPLKSWPVAVSQGYEAAIQQVIQLQNTGSDAAGLPVRTFVSVCQVLVQDATGRTVFSNTIQQPFRTSNRAGEMYGKAELTEADWVALLVQSVGAALQEKGPRRLGIQSFYRPALSMSDFGFLPNQTFFYQWKETETGSSFKGSNREKKIRFGRKDHPPVLWTSQQSFSTNETYIRGEYRTRMLVQNTQSGTEYDITAAGTVVRDSARYFAKTVSPVQVRCTAQRLLVGDYTVTQNVLEGQVGYDIYTLRALPLRNTFELSVNDVARAVIQKGGKHAGTQDMYLHIHKDATPNEVDKILITWLIFQLGNDLGKDFMGY